MIASVSVWEAMVLVAILLGFVLALLWLSSRVVRSLPGDKRDQIAIRGLGLPNGSVRALLALLIVAAFVVFAFVGDELVPDKETHGTVLTAFVAITGSVTGYYFGARTGQTLGTPPSPDEASAQPDEGDPDDED